MSEERQWSGQTHGTPWMHRALIAMFKVCPLELMYLIMALVIPFYMIFYRPGYLSIYHYLRRRQGWGPVRSFFGCYANHFLFGTALMDRFAAYSGRHFRTDMHDFHLFSGLSAQPEGFLMYTSHVGNPEMTGYMLKSEVKRMNVITFPGEKSSIRAWRENMLGPNNIRLISATEDMSWLFTLNAALADGEIVNIHADRSFGSPKTLEVNLLGAQAHLPLGPFSLAAMRNLPVLASFSLKAGIRRYNIFIYRLDTPEMAAMGREERQQALADAYARLLDDVLHRHPLQWYNFYEFWN